MERCNSTRHLPEAFVVASLSDSGIDEVAILFPPLRRNPSAYSRSELLPPPSQGKTISSVPEAFSESPNL